MSTVHPLILTGVRGPHNEHVNHRYQRKSVLGKTVLIVEDNPDALDLLGMYFEAHGFNVKSARDGKEGWQALLEERPAAVLSDYLMPNMDGVELCERIRADQRYADIPFILMTGTPHLPTSSCQDMLVTKPLKLEPLVEFIRNAPDEKNPKS